MPRKIPESELNAAVAELDKVRQNWLKRPGVTAVDVGYKIKEGKLTDELAIRVHVKRKLPRETLDEHGLFPEHLGRFSVDVIEADYGPQTVD
jgi:hypothetical protein